MGKVVLVGAGPGDPDLLSIKGHAYLENADCIVYDRLINPSLLSISSITCEKIYVGKENHNHILPQDRINELLEQKAHEYKLVVRLKGGDPYVFGRGSEEALYLKEKGIEVEIVPGISSAIAALSYAGIPITHRGVAKGFQVLTAHSKKDIASEIDYSSLCDEDITLVFLMGLSHVYDITKGLIEAGRDSNTPAAVISNGTTNHQKIVIGTLNNLFEKVKDSNIVSPAIIVVGRVVNFADKLNFFENRPLFGKKYFLPTIHNFNYNYVTGVIDSDTNRLEEMLEKNGADVVRVETGKIEPIECSLDFLKDANVNDYIVFTSANGVKAFFWNLLNNGYDLRVIYRFRFAVIGEKTKETLKNFGIIADLVAKAQNGKDLAKLLNIKANACSTIYWFTTTDSSKGFKETLDKNLILKEVVCYRNISYKIDATDVLLNEIKSCDGVIYTSGSNARATIPFFKNVLPQTIYSIGPACTDMIKELGCKNIHQAKISSYDGIMEMLL